MGDCAITWLSNKFILSPHYFDNYLDVRLLMSTVEIRGNFDIEISFSYSLLVRALQMYTYQFSGANI